MMADSPEKLFQLAQSLESGGDFAAAADAYRRGLELAPDTGEAHHNLAGILRRLGLADESLAYARRAAQLLPGRPPVLNSLGQSLEQSDLAEEAEAAFRDALTSEPNYPPAAANLGRLLERRQRPDEAAAVLAPAQAANPGDAALNVNLANAYLGLGRPDEAASLLNAATALDPDLAPALNSLGTAHYIMHDWAAAAAAFTRAIALDPEFAQARENLAQTRFRMGSYAVGWPDYEWRWKNPDNHLTKINFAAPEWDGKPLAGRTLLLHAEQGFGDAIQFVRFAAAIEKQGGRILLACQKELVSLLTGACKLDDVVALDGPVPDHQCHAALLSLPRMLGITGPWPAGSAPYLSAAPHAAITDVGRTNMRIGAAWAGRRRHFMDAYRNRSCQALDFHALAERPGVSLFGLQTDTAGEGPPFAMTDLSPHMTDFAASAALVQAMDIIVTVDTALAHLAGALGKPCAVMLAYTSDWRWNDIYGRIPWYPSVFAFRQPAPGDWSGAFSDLILAFEAGLPIPGGSKLKLP
ncbi:MAG: tetratricopeptide repeat protein [Rhodospirillaceae bacterium]|nr:tetratricopeptide repeat protein [Rhodospirillaceae bacterium]